MEKEAILKQFNIVNLETEFSDQFFYQWIKSDPLDYLCGYPYQEEFFFSHHLATSHLQDPLLYRLRKRAVWISNFLIDEKGILNLEHLNLILSSLNQFLFIPYPESSHEWLYMAQMKEALFKLSQEKNLQALLKRFYLPSNPAIEDIIRNSLFLPSYKKIEASHVRRSVLSALLTPLRQTIGSCFATAPAILIQKHKLDYLLEDLLQLLNKEQLTRTYEGTEYISPACFYFFHFSSSLSLNSSQKIWLSPAFIATLENMSLISSTLSFPEKTSKCQQLVTPFLTDQDSDLDQLLDFLLTSKYPTEKEREPQKKRALAIYMSFEVHPLLKTWEFTIASFSQLNATYANYHLRFSLGLDPKTSGGIGSLIFNYLNAQIKKIELKSKEYHEEYTQAFHNTKAQEALLKNADSYRDMMQRKAFYDAEAHHMYALLDMRDASHKEASQYSEFFEFLIKEYDKGLKENFQELYDPTILELKSDHFADSPAGFRLVYKNNSPHPIKWILIKNKDSYLSALKDFFSSIERDLIFNCSWARGKEEIAKITEQILLFLYTDEFWLFNESQLKHENEVRTPWSYISGGTIEILTQIYFKKHSLTQVHKTIDSPLNLAIFLIDLLKELPPSYFAFPDSSFLMHSPTHAFLLNPFHVSLEKGWADHHIFTYTWVRDHILKNPQNYYANTLLPKEQQEYLITLFHTKWPVKGKPSANSPQTIPEFRNFLIRFYSQKNLPFKEELIDSFLLESFPLFSKKEALPLALELALHIAPDKDLSMTIQYFFRKIKSDMIRAKLIREIVKAALILVDSTRFLSLDLDQLILSKAHTLNIVLSAPLTFADTNWAHYYFSLLINPGTNQLEIWRTDRLGLSGIKMKGWEKYLEGGKESDWCVFTNSREYS